MRRDPCEQWRVPLRRGRRGPPAHEGTREINTVVLRRADLADVLEVEVEANLTHEELLQALPAEEPRLVIHELSFASREGAR